MSRFLLPFELDGRQHPVSYMFSFWIVEHLDVIEHILPGFGPRPVCLAPDPLALEEIEEALHHGVVMAVSPTAHGVFKIMSFQERRPIHAGEL